LSPLINRLPHARDTVPALQPDGPKFDKADGDSYTRAVLKNIF